MRGVAGAIGVTGGWVRVPCERLTVMHIDPKYRRVLDIVVERPPLPRGVDASGLALADGSSGDLLRLNSETGAEGYAVAVARAHILSADEGRA